MQTLDRHERVERQTQKQYLENLYGTSFVRERGHLLEQMFLPLQKHFAVISPQDITGLDVLCLCSGGGEVGAAERTKWQQSGIDVDWLKGNFTPWRARLLHVLGNRVTAIDIADQSAEPYQSHTLDLRDPRALDCIGTKSMDVISMHAAADVLRPVRGTIRKYVRSFVGQLRRILRSDGLLVTNEADRWMRLFTGDQKHGFIGTNAHHFPSLKSLNPEQQAMRDTIVDMIGPDQPCQL